MSSWISNLVHVGDLIMAVDTESKDASSGLVLEVEPHTESFPMVLILWDNGYIGWTLSCEILKLS